MSKKLKSLQDGISATVDKAISKGDADSLKSKENLGFQIQWIDIKEIEVSEHNFYGLRQIKELAEDILNDGLEHNFVVNKIAENRYKLISGERRFTAIDWLNKNGHKKYSKLPCKVIMKNEVDAQIRLIKTNSLTRVLSDSEKLIQVEQLKILYKAKKQNGEKIEGTLRDKIAEILSMSRTQVGRYESILKGSKELQDAMKSDKINITNATELAKLSHEGQKLALDILDNSEEFINVVDLKNDIKEIEKEDIELEEANEKIAEIKNTYLNKNKYKEENKEANSKKILRNIKSLSDKIDKITCEVSQLNKIDDNLLDIFDKLESSFLGLKEELALISKNDNEDNN